MSTETIKSLRREAEAIIESGIKNREAFEAALPILIDLQGKSEGAKKHLTACNTAAAALSKLCSAYALAHPSAFDAGKLVENQQEVQTGDITVGERVFHFAHGYEGYERREEGAKKTQAFIETLPEHWRKSSLSIDTTAINDDKPSDEDLAKYGLREKVKDVWSEVEEM